jgi:hypothetical protein
MKRTGENKINSLHRDLRRRMFEAGLQTLMMEEGSREQVKMFLEGLKELTGYSALVTMEEEKNFFPGIISVAPFMIPLLEQEHVKIKDLGERICILADDYEEAYADCERKNTLLLVQAAYHEWMAFLMQHLVREEMIMKEVMPQETVKERVIVLVAA